MPNFAVADDHLSWLDPSEDPSKTKLAHCKSSIACFELLPVSQCYAYRFGGVLCELDAFGVTSKRYNFDLLLPCSNPRTNASITFPSPPLR
jgi:hypothetical protein